MGSCRRLTLAICLLAMTQGCAELEEVRTRGKELEGLNEKQAVALRALQERLRSLNKDVSRWKDMYGEEKRISRELQALLARQKTEKETLHRELERLAEEVGAQTRMTSEGLALVLEQAILFEPGKNKLKDSAKRALGKVGTFVKGKPGGLRIDGHTDSDPIKHSKAQWGSNHDLSCGRALAVFDELVAQGVPATRMSVQGFGPNRPLADNKAKEGKSQNRRVELLLVQQSDQDLAERIEQKRIELSQPKPDAPEPGAKDLPVPK